MDEHRDDCFLCHHPLLKTILISLLVFSGAFAAFYVVTDWHYKRMLDPAVQMRKVEKIMMQEQKKFDKIQHKDLANVLGVEKEIQHFIKVEKTPQNYKIAIDLRPFNNDEKNIEVLTDGNALTINAACEKEKRGRNEITRLSQTFTFDEKVDLDKINKIHQGHEYIVVIPIE